MAIIKDVDSALTTREAARVLGLATQTLCAFRCRHKGPRYVKIGRAVRYLPRDLSAFLESHAVNAGGQRR
jgi:predicted DNA-binding transcriptional regulator AlpA